MAGRVVAGSSSGEPQPALTPTVVLLDVGSGRQYLETLQKGQQQGCRERLADMQTTLLGLAQVETQRGKGSLTVTGDQDGYFSLEHVPPGAYLLVAMGHVGSAQAIWTQPVEVEKDRATVVKLASPLLSCPDAGQGWQH